MKKFKLLGVLLFVATFICGCSCAKVDETTYENAVNAYKNTDGISFSRVETIVSNNEPNMYSRKKVDATFVFDSNREVSSMQYSFVKSEGSIANGVNISETKEYYYSQERETLYTYQQMSEIQLQRYKESGVTYNSKFNVNSCEDRDCMLLIVGNFAPIFNLNEVSEFRIEENDGGAIASFKTTCPNYEHCESSSQMIDYVVELDPNGNIASISYDIVNKDINYSIKYTFFGYGSNNVKVDFPANLESYIEK